MFNHAPPGYQCPFCARETYGCDGISTRQHNEPDGDQDVWHYHVHVFPRYRGDGLYETKPSRAFATGAERRPYADRLRACFDGGR